MNSNDYKNLPRCTIDYPLELTPEEIGSAIGPVNTLLKSSYLLGSSRDTDSTFQSLFDLAEEIGAVSCAGYVSGEPDADRFELCVARHLAQPDGSDSLFFTPAAIARHFGKAVLLDSGSHPIFRPVCARWNAGFLAVFPLRKDREFIGAVVFGKQGPTPFTQVQVKLLWVLAMQAENHLLQCEAVKALSFYSFLDPLTHLSNRRYFDLQLEKEILRSRRSGKPFSLLMVDLDGFKSYNDRFLHTAGDIALQEFAGILSDSIREVDTAARLGGDEFAIILVESSAEGARDLALRVIDRFGKHLLPGMENLRTERLSASVGVSAFPADSFDNQDLVRKADRALYMAKNQGTGKVCLYHEIADLLTAKPTPHDIPLQKIYSAARSVVDMDKFLEILLLTAMQGMSAARGSIVIGDAGGDQILRAAIGFTNGEQRFAPGTTLPPGVVTSWVLEHKEPLIVSGPQDSPLQKPLKKNGYQTESFLSVPLIHENRVLGVLHLTNRKNRQPFTKEDHEAFRPIANEIASIVSQGIAFRENLKSFAISMLYSLANALELRFPFLSGHSARVSDISIRAGEKLGLAPEELNSLRIAAALHDIGIVGIPGTILSKKQRLTDRELEIARKHAFLGFKMLEELPGMETARLTVLEHHEYFNGAGYPYGLSGKDLSLSGRILAVAEFYDSIISKRPHRGGLQREEALQLIKNGSNTLFDPEVARLFVEEPSITSP